MMRKKGAARLFLVMRLPGDHERGYPHQGSLGSIIFSWLLRTRRLSDGTLLTEAQVKGNLLVDDLDKSAAEADRLPRETVDRAFRLWERVTAVAMWIGKVTREDNHVEELCAWRGPGGSRPVALRDSVKFRPRATTDEAAATAARIAPGSMGHARIETLPPPRRRASSRAAEIAKEHEQREVATQERHLIRVVSERTAKLRPPVVSGSQRIAALRERVRAREAAAGRCRRAASGRHAARRVSLVLSNRRRNPYGSL